MITLINDTEADYLYNSTLYRISLRNSKQYQGKQLYKELYLNNDWVSGVNGILTIEELALRIYKRSNGSDLPTIIIRSFCRDYVGMKYPEYLI